MHHFRGNRPYAQPRADRDSNLVPPGYKPQLTRIVPSGLGHNIGIQMNQKELTKTFMIISN